MKHSITYRLSDMPMVSLADKRVVSEAYKHKVRTAPFHVLFYILEGQLPVVEDGVEYILNEGTLFFLKAGVQHWGEHYISAGTSFIFVHFFLPEAIISEAPQKEFIPPVSMSKNRFRPRDFQETVITLPKRIDNLQGSDLEHNMCQLASYYHSGDPFRPLRMNNMLSNILADCMQLKFKENVTMAELRIQEILTFLQVHCREPFRSREIEQHMGLSYKYMEEFFKKRIGMTIQQYHTSLRIHEAEQLLRTTQYSVSEISESLGYQDPLYFSNVFKKATGVSPRDYRKNIDTIIIG